MMSKVYTIGIGRTGTRSLTYALRALGYRAAHWSDLYPRIRADLTLPPEVFDEFNAFADTIIPIMYEELWRPEDKFILTLRDVNDWYISLCKYRRQEDIVTKIMRDMRRRILDTTGTHEPTLKYAFLRHEIHVKNFFRDKDNLLIMNICDGDGWEKLCPFLGREIPNIKFPHKNRSK
jgi:hypothetical protein